MEKSSSVKYTYNIPPDFSYLDKWFKPESHAALKETNKWLGDFSWKDDDVTICSFPRSGTHLYWHVVRMIVQKEAKIPDDAMEDSCLTFYVFQDRQKQGRRVWSAHSLPCDITDNVLLNGNRKFIYVMRNPKDVISSYYAITLDFEKSTHKIMSWEEFFNASATNNLPPNGRSWFDHVRGWAEYTDVHPAAQILPVWFEDFIEDRPAEIRKLANFLEVDLSEDLIEAIVEQSLFKNMKNAPISDKIGDVGPNMKPKYYRKGLIGDWKNIFTVAQNESFDRQIEKYMHGFKWKIT